MAKITKKTIKQADEIDTSASEIKEARMRSSDKDFLKELMSYIPKDKDE